VWQHHKIEKKTLKEGLGDERERAKRESIYKYLYYHQVLLLEKLAHHEHKIK
jgi:hypothetical protein